MHVLISLEMNDSTVIQYASETKMKKIRYSFTMKTMSNSFPNKHERNNMKFLIIIISVLAIISAAAIPSYAASEHYLEGVQHGVGSASGKYEGQPEKIIAVMIIFGTAFAGFMYFISCLMVSKAASLKGRSAIGFFIYAAVATPLMGFLAVIAFPQRKWTGIKKVELTAKPTKIS